MADDWDVDDVVEADPSSIEVVDRKLEPVKTADELAMERLQGYEDEIFAKASEIVDGTLRFQDIDPENPVPPQEWLDELGTKEAVEKRMRIAKSSWMSSKDAPFALQAAKALVVGIIKARSTERAAPKSLNVVAITVNNRSDYPEKEIE